MKKHAATILILMLVGLTGLVNAQTVWTTIRADVPFDFIASGKTMPAGEYKINVTGDGQTILVIGAQRQSVYALPHMTQSLNKAEGTTLVFHRYGDRRFLAAVSLEGSKIGYELPESKVEAELQAKNMAKSDEILVALNK